MYPNKPAALEYLAQQHAAIEEYLRELEGSAQQLQTSVDSEVERSLHCLDRLQEITLLHFMDEEESLFPRLRPKLTRDAEAHLDVLEEQHRESWHALDMLRGWLTDLRTAPEGLQRSMISEYLRTLDTFIDGSRHHMDVEQSSFYRVAARLLSPPEWAEVEAQISRRNTHYGCEPVVTRLSAAVGCS
jgi:iron-sulfur cluster repair protein YtfE (RIC family)